MNRNSLFAGFFTLALGMLLGITPVLAAESTDREAIEALMWRYARALDSFDADAYAAVYTPDGQFGTGTTATKGTEALKKMITGLKDGRDKRKAAGEAVPPMYHMTTDSWIELVDATHARHHSYWQTVFGASGPGSKPVMEAAGRGVDELVKVNGKWLIKTRDVAPKD